LQMLKIFNSPLPTSSEIASVDLLQTPSFAKPLRILILHPTNTILCCNETRAYVSQWWDMQQCFNILNKLKDLDCWTQKLWSSHQLWNNISSSVLDRQVNTKTAEKWAVSDGKTVIKMPNFRQLLGEIYTTEQETEQLMDGTYIQITGNKESGKGNFHKKLKIEA
jgi:hypothetical protein